MERPRTTRSSFRPSSQQELYLRTIGTLTAATIEMVNRVHHDEDTVTTTGPRLYQLANEAYLHELAWKRNPTKKGNPKKVYKLTNRSFRHLVSHNLAGRGVIRPSDFAQRQSYPLTHLMDANEILVHGLQMARLDPSLRCYIYSEPFLRFLRLKVDRRTPIVPDGFMQLIKRKPSGPPGHAVFVFEIDRGTERSIVIEEKLLNYCRLDGSPAYLEAFDTDRLVVVWMVTEGGEKRRNDLLSFARRILTRSRRDQFDLFKFGVGSGQSAREFFFSPRFLGCQDDTFESLLPRSWLP